MIEAPNMPNLNSLVELGNRGGVDIRPTLLRVVTDLYVQKPKHTTEEEQHYTELALRLIDLVDTRTRSIVAEKIAAYPGAPAAVKQRLFGDRPPATVIKDSPDTAKEQASTPAAPSRPKDATPAELSDLFLTANAEERRLILLNLPYALLPPAAAIPALAARESVHRLEAAALGHNIEVFARELERMFGISRTLARRLIDDPSGEPIVVLALALNMQSAVLQRILLCLNPAISQSVQRVYELALLHEDVDVDSARRLIAIWQASHPAQSQGAGRAAAHRPYYAQGDKDKPAILSERPRIRWEEHAKSRRESA